MYWKWFCLLCFKLIARSSADDSRIFFTLYFFFFFVYFFFPCKYFAFSFNDSFALNKSKEHNTQQHKIVDLVVYDATALISIFNTYTVFRSGTESWKRQWVFCIFKSKFDARCCHGAGKSWFSHKTERKKQQTNIHKQWIRVMMIKPCTMDTTLVD